MVNGGYLDGNVLFLMEEKMELKIICCGKETKSFANSTYICESCVKEYVVLSRDLKFKETSVLQQKTSETLAEPLTKEQKDYNARSYKGFMKKQRRKNYNGKRKNTKTKKDTRRKRA